MHTTPSAPVRSQPPRAFTVFGAAFVAGAAAAFGVNSVLNAHLAQARPQVESESILVAIRSLPAGSPVTVWDVALRDWPKAMVPAAAMRVTDDLENLVARHPLREGQPILAVQLTRVDTAEAESSSPLTVVSNGNRATTPPEQDLWAPETVPARPEPVVVGRRTPAPQAGTPAPLDTPTAAVAGPLTVTPPVETVVVPDPVPRPAPEAAPQAVASTEPVVVAPSDPPETLTLPAAPAANDVASTEQAAPPPAGSDTAAVTDAAAPAAESDTPAATAPVRTAQRPRSSAIQFLAVPAPESLEADAVPPAPQPPAIPSARDDGTRGDAPARSDGDARVANRRGDADAPRAPSQSGRTPQATRKPQRGQRAAADPRAPRGR